MDLLRYLDGETAYALAKTFAECCITGRQGNLIEQTAVKDVLSNIFYIEGQWLCRRSVIEKEGFYGSEFWCNVF